MQLQELTKNLFDFAQKSKVVFLSWEPSNFDSTTLSKLFVKIKFQNSKNESQIISLNASNAVVVHNILKRISEQKKMFILGHNFKPLFTLFKRLTGNILPFDNLFDLGWFESYSALPSSKDQIAQMVANFKLWMADENAMKIYRSVFAKLITQTLPDVESVGLVNTNLGLMVFPNFVVEGQNNGRLSCVCEYKRCYNPHSLSDDEKNDLILPNMDEFFVWFDFRNMEVAVLAELADDDNLKHIIKKYPNMVYEKIFETATGATSPDARKLAKQMFLPCIYGQGQNGLSKSLDISVDQASIYLHNLREKFSKSFAYVENFQKEAAENGTVKDAFGRIRRFSSDEPFKARNFAIQAPSALLCLESLVNLHDASNGIFRVVFTVHDGYVIAAKKNVVEEAFHKAKSALQKPSSFIPIEFRVATKVGKNLGKMQELGKRT